MSNRQTSKKIVKKNPSIPPPFEEAAKEYVVIDHPNPQFLEVRTGK